MKFSELELEPEVFDGLDAMNFVEMTPVQEHTIPVILSGRDIIGCAQTGTGKTAAYTLPLLNRLTIEGNPDNVVKSLIIVPTRELAQQIDMQFQGFSYFLPVSTTVVYGGGDGKGWEVQKRGMLMGADVVIATPGRLIAHLTNSGVDLSHVECLILDEADRMLDMGFSDDIMKIISYLPKERQTIMFSATLPPKIRELARTILNDPAEVTIAVSKPNEAISQSAYICYESQKLGIVREMFAEPKETKTIIFSSSKQKTKELAHVLKRMKFNVAAMHSDLEQSQREEVILNFKNNKVDILVATDIVARGIDIEDIGLVVNYDVPHDPEDYIHRIGRTARAAATGAAVTLVCEEEQGKFYRIEKFMEREVEKTPLPESVGEGPAYTPEAFEHKGRGRSGRGRNSRRGGAKRGGGRNDKPRSEARKVADSNRTSNDSKATTDGAQKPQEDNKKRRYRGNRRRKRADKGNSVNTTQPTQEKA
jgi:superfamily II DNA/RNA helicase